MVFNPLKIIVADCYVYEYLTGLWENENFQDTIFNKSRTGFMEKFYSCTILQVSNLQTDIDISNINSEYVLLSHYIRELLPLKMITKEVVKNLGMNSEKLDFVSSYTVYENNNCAIVVATVLSMTPNTKHIAVKYHWFRQIDGNEYFIKNV